MKNKAKIISLLILMALFPGIIFPQAGNAGKEPVISDEDSQVQAVMQEAIKEAVKEIDEEKAKEQKSLANEFTVKLDAAISEWLVAARAAKSKELNALTHRDWADLNKFTSPIPYDYYLREFDYAIEKKDVLKTDSFIKPYKAFARILEKLYVERYHSPDAAYPEQYYYTVVTPLNITFEYHGDKFIAVDVKSGNVDLESGWIK